MPQLTIREVQSLFIRSAPNREHLRTEVARALDIPFDQVRDLNDEVDPAVRLEAHEFASGFQVLLDLYIDPRRAQVLPLEVLAIILARGLGKDVAHHDGSVDPYAYVLVRPDGGRFAADDCGDEIEGLRLDEAMGRLRELPRLTVKPDLLLIVTKNPGACGSCRHANQGTADFAEQHIFCKWGGPARQPAQLCDKPAVAVPALYGPLVSDYFYYQAYDGANCTWQYSGDYRILAEDAESAVREQMQADLPLIPRGVQR
jgi:hypothetical protein